MSHRLSPTAQIKYDAWWKRQVAGGIPIDDNFECAVLEAYAHAAYIAGRRQGLKEWRSARTRYYKRRLAWAA